MRMERIDTRVASGFRDFLPHEARARQAMMDRIVAVFERHGFSPVETPALERLEVLTGGDPAFAKQLYRARITDDDEPLGLRFDLTVPLARYVAAHASALSFPFCAYHIGNVWRGEHAQTGRYRQFVQCDADIIGHRSTLADAQVLMLVHDIFRILGLAEKTLLRVSNRAVLNGFAEFLGFDADRTGRMLRAVDRLGRQGWEAVAKELEASAGLDSQQIDAVQELLTLGADSPEALLDEAHRRLEFATQSHRGVDELRELVRHLDASGLPRDAWKLDLSIARGLGYYTGMVFETMLTGSEAYGSVCSGGRYDNLIGRFAPMELSGVGMSVGVDRLFAALDELGLVPPAGTAGVAVLDFEPTAREAVLDLTRQLRDAGITTTLYLGSEETLKGQLSWAVKTGFPKVVIMGAKEHERGIVQLKDTVNRTQEEVQVAALPGHLKH